MAENIKNGKVQAIIRAIIIIATIYFFLLSIKLLGHSFKSFGHGFAETLIYMTSNPFSGLIIGIVATSLIQSSSTTTSLVVGLVAGGALTLDSAIPIIMGANIGTTITNTLVSFGHIKNRNEFKRAFGASIVHDFFNILAVIILFPIEMYFHPIKKTAIWLETVFSGAGGYKAFNPLKFILDPVIKFIDEIFGFLPFANILLLIFALVLLFYSLTWFYSWLGIPFFNFSIFIHNIVIFELDQHGTQNSITLNVCIFIVDRFL